MAQRRGITSFGATLVVVLVLTLFSLFAWRVWTYKRLIERGEAIQLPQFSGQFSAAREAAPGSAVPANLATEDDPSIGPADAKLTVVEFLDYQCPYCNEASSTFREMAAAYGDRVRFIVRDFPVQELHPDAVSGAEAAGCAEAQGKFWPMHDLLFRHQPEWAGLAKPLAYFIALGDSAGLDRARLTRCITSRAAQPEVEADAASSANAGASATPTFYVEKLLVSGAAPLAVFRHLLDSLYQAKTGAR